jgi:hypothetical protein
MSGGEITALVVLSSLVALVIIACTAIVFITDYLRKTQQAGLDAYLKKEMLSQGMSAADIKAVLEANSDSEARQLPLGANQGLGLDFGKLKVGVFNLRKAVSTAREAVRQ